MSAGDVDLADTLERRELADLLGRALAQLPPDTREALVRRYVEESPHADIAARLGISEDAVKKRVERGRQALAQVLATDLRTDALAYGLLTPQADAWQETRMWCPGCGRNKVLGQFRPNAGELRLHCPACSPPDAYYINAHWKEGFADLHTYKPAVSRVLALIHEIFHVLPADGAVRCSGCGDRLPIRRGIPSFPPQPPWDRWGIPGFEAIYFWCPRCESGDLETWHSLTWSLPAARRFWRDHPRMRFLPQREIEAEGSPAVLTGFESISDGARLDVVAHRDSLRVLSINGKPPESADSL